MVRAVSRGATSPTRTVLSEESTTTAGSGIAPTRARSETLSI